MPQTKPVIVVGGGWAGLAAAIELCHYNVPVLLLESAKQLGGRARSIKVNNLHLDNGQHLMLGAYQQTLGLIKRIGVTEDAVVHRQPLALKWLRKNQADVLLNTPRLPAPLHLLWGLIRSRGLSLRERLAAIRFCHYLNRSGFSLSEDCSVQSLLNQHRQPNTVVSAIWQPLCIGALNTHIHEASAQVFLRTLRDSFTHARHWSDLLITRAELGDMLPNPGLDFIETHGGNIKLGHRVTRLSITDNRINGVELGDTRFSSAHVILATPHTITRRLTKPHTELDDVTQQLSHLKDRPICTVYLQYANNTRLGRHLLGSVDTLTQWIFDRSVYGQDGLMAVVVSGIGEHMSWNNQQLCDHVEAELASKFPHWPTPHLRHVIREKRATFASTVDIQQHRPAANTPVKGLWLAGDYTDVGLPATLEGAVRSGIRCAQHIINAPETLAPEQ